MMRPPNGPCISMRGEATSFLKRTKIINGQFMKLLWWQAALIVFFCLSLQQAALAVPASPDESEVYQPSGKAIKVYLRGDEWNNWVETVEGYTIEKGVDGYWRYVLRYEGKKPVLSNVCADKAPPPGLKKSLKPIP